MYVLNIVLVDCTVRKDGERGTYGSGKGEGGLGQVVWYVKSVEPQSTLAQPMEGAAGVDGFIQC